MVVAIPVEGEVWVDTAVAPAMRGCRAALMLTLLRAEGESFLHM